MVKNTGKTRLLIYTGHSELIGGDAHYIFDIVNKLNKHKFSPEIYTDISRLFSKRADAWLKVDVPIAYIDTRPALFKEGRIAEFYYKLCSNQDHIKGVKKIIYHVLDTQIAGHKLYTAPRFVLRRITLRALRSHIKNALVFYKLFKEKRGAIDVFHFNNGGYPAKTAGLIAIIMARYFKVPKIVMTIHNIARPKSIFSPIENRFDYFIARYCNKIIAASEMVRKKLIEVRGFPGEKIVTIYCGLDARLPMSPDEVESKKSSMGIGLKRPLLIIVGNIEEERKGHVPLLKAMARVKTEIPNVVLLIVGSGSDERLKYLKGLTKELLIEDNVVFLGYRMDIDELNSMADIALVPSVGVEATPYTIKEASRLGKPVITTSIGGCPEAIINGVTGFIVEPYNIKQLSESIVRLVKDEQLRAQMGSAAKEYFMNNFLLNKKVLEHECLYNNEVRI